jgi:Cadherin-like domain
VFIDGVQRASDANGGNPIDPTGNVRFGVNDTVSAARFHKGGLDGIAVYDHMIPPAELVELYTGGNALATVSISVNNSPPTATNLNAAETYTEDTALNLTNIVISDIDSANVTATLTLSNAAAGSLNTATSGALTSTYVAGTGVWTASGAIADVNTLLAGLTFTPTGDFNGAFSIATSVGDGVAAPVTGTKAVNGIAVNDPPITTPVTLSPVAEDSGTRLITQAELLANANDVDGPALIATNLAISSAGTLVDNGDGTWSYNAAANEDTAVSFNYTVSDGTLTTAGSANLNLTPVNDAPASTPVILASINEDSGARLIMQGELLANASDVDGPALIATGLTISSGAGTLVDNGNGTWSYTPALDDDTAVSFNYAVSDGTLTTPGSANLDLTPVNDAPVAANQSVATLDNTPVVLRPGDLGYADAEGVSLARIRITALPSEGVLSLGNAPVSVNQEITAADLAAGNLQFVPRAGLSAQTLATIGFQVSDGLAYSTGNNISVLITPATIPVANPVTPYQPTAEVTTAPVTVAAPPAVQAATTPATVAVAAPALAGAGTLVDPLSPSPTVTLDATVAQRGASGVSELADIIVARSAGLGQIALPGAITAFMLNGMLAQFNLEALKPLEASVSDRLASATSSAAFIGELDRVRDSVRADEVLERNIIVSSVATGATMSVGYVLWLLRGGLLLTSLLSSLPAWRFVDPLPVMGRLQEDDDEDDDAANDTVESIVRGARPT